jgi:hypothetical protein
MRIVVLAGLSDGVSFALNVTAFDVTLVTYAMKSLLYAPNEQPAGAVTGITWLPTTVFEVRTMAAFPTVVASHCELVTRNRTRTILVAYWLRMKICAWSPLPTGRAVGSTLTVRIAGVDVLDNDAVAQYASVETVNPDMGVFEVMFTCREPAAGVPFTSNESTGG